MDRAQAVCRPDALPVGAPVFNRLGVQAEEVLGVSAEGLAVEGCGLWYGSELGDGETVTPP